MLAAMSDGLAAALQPYNLWIMLIGNLVGISFGAMPGLSATMAISVLIPVTFTMKAAPGLLLLASAYCGAMFGGSISAVLLNTPGTVAAAATSLDGYPMALKGRGGEALGIAAFASWFGGTLSVIALLAFGPPIARIALKFGPAEYAALSMLGLVLIVSISRESMVKGLISGVMGLLISTIGLDQVVAFPRFAFGNINLMAGISLVPALIGMFSLSQVYMVMETATGLPLIGMELKDKVRLKLSEVRRMLWPMTKGAVIGTVVGALPGAGATIATFLAYDLQKKSSKHPESYGTGEPLGVATVESTNNAVTGGAFTVMLTLGIPGNEATAIMLGGLTILGIQAGPNLFSTNSDIVYTFIMGLFIANLMMLIIGICSARYVAKIVKTPNSILCTMIIVLSVVGSYAINNRMFDVWVLFILGIIGFLMKKSGFSPVPLVLGLILGPLIEANLIRALTVSGGSWAIFVQRPLSRFFLIVLAAMLVYPFAAARLREWRRARAGAEA